MRHLHAVPDHQLSDDRTVATEQPEGTWALDLGEHDGQPCPECNTTIGIPWAIGIHDGHGRLCTRCTATHNEHLASVLEAVDQLDAALAFTPPGPTRAELINAFALAAAHVIDTRTAEDST